MNHKLPIYLSMLGGVSFTIANVMLAVQAETALLRTVGILFTAGSVCFFASSLLQITNPKGSDNG